MHIEIQNCFSFWGTSSPRPPTGALPLDPTGGLLSPNPLHRTSPHILYQVYAPWAFVSHKNIRADEVVDTCIDLSSMQNLVAVRVGM